jgi:osmotically-inducible protein OsmY
MKNYSLALLVTVLLFGVAPLASADNDMAPSSPTRNADNTGVNTRDRNSEMTMPTDQSSSRADTDVTANIRKAIVDDHSLSVDAQNVKVITANGRVTLRGPVRSEMEKKKVLAMAKQHAAGNMVFNDLEIAAP